MKNLNKKKNGFSLIELLLVLGIIAALAITVFMIYPKVATKNNVRDEVNNINAILSGTIALYSSMPTFDGVSNKNLIESHVFPEVMLSSAKDDVVLNGFKGLVEVAPSKDFDGKLEIKYTNVPSEACVNMTTSLLPQFSVIKVNNVTIKHENGTFNIKNATEVCNIKNEADMLFIS